jgi:hypothetical protein
MLSTNILANTSKRYYQKALRIESLSSNVKECQYAVRGAIPIRGEEIRLELLTGKANKYNFTKTVPCNIGNP